MPPHRNALILAAALLASAASGASAQGQMPCANEIVPLRQAVETSGQAVKSAVERKAPREEVCGRMKQFAASEAKFVKYLETNQGWCSVPDEAIKQVKAAHSHTLKMRGQVCAAAPAAQQGPPPSLGLSEALGTARRTAPVDNKTDRGTYNTLTGNPLTR